MTAGSWGHGLGLRTGRAAILSVAAFGCAAPDGDGGWAPTGGGVLTGDASFAPSDTGDSGDALIDPLAPWGDDWMGGTLASPVGRADVVIVGGGPAGLSAARAAMETGASVIVLEKGGAFGGSAVWSSGIMTFAGTPEQAAEGIEDDLDTLSTEWEGMTGGAPAAAWTESVIREGLPFVYEWMGVLGLSLHLLQFVDEGASVRRLHGVVGGGPALVDALSDGVSDAWLGHTADGLVVGGGRVQGVALTDGEWVAGRAVVLATGGFLRDLDRVAAETGADPDGLWFSTGPHADGWGLRVAEAAGGVMQNGGAVGMYAHGVADLRRPKEELAFDPLDSTLWVNSSGARFFDETRHAHYSAGRAVMGQSGQRVFAVFDAQVRSRAGLIDPILEDGEGGAPTMDEYEDAGGLLSGDDLVALAGAMGVDASTLESEVIAFNAAATEHGSDGIRDGVVDTPPLLAPPFYAVRVVPVVAKAFGGVAVDLSGRVVRADGVPVPGLYAAGELTGMAGGSIVGDRGYTGSLSAVIWSGLVAGWAAAGE